MKADFKNEEMIIAALKKGGTETNAAMTYLYENKLIFNRIYNYVLYNGGNKQDATDVYIESLIILEKNIRKNKFKANSSLITYLTGIAKLCWSQMKRSKGVNVIGDENLALEKEALESPEDLFLAKEIKQKLEAALIQLGEKCRILLKLWSQNYSSEEISKKLNFASSGAVRKQKFYCKERLAEIIKKDEKDFSAFLNG